MNALPRHSENGPHAAMSKAQKISGTPDVAQLMRAADRSAKRSFDARYDTRLQASNPPPLAMSALVGIALSFGKRPSRR